VTELPSGTVTFLFTDIEGSTRLLKSLGDGYETVLNEHDRCLREAFEAAQGQEVDTQGDAFFAAFARASDAVAAAVEVQRRLPGCAWPEGADVRVRVGIHTAEPKVGEHRYIGIGVHRAARICAAAHGGQVLLSSATRELVEDSLPEGVDLRDLGSHSLKDLDRPEHLFQVTGPELPDDFPSVRAAEALVSAETPFAGREGELAAAAQASLRRRALSRRSVLVAMLAGAIAAAVAVPLFALGQGEKGVEAAAAGVPIPRNSVAIIDPVANRVLAAVPVGERPLEVAVDASDAWVANYLDATLTKIDLTTRKPVKTIGLPVTPTGVEATNGAVWVVYNGCDIACDVRAGAHAGSGERASLLKIDSATNDIIWTRRLGKGGPGRVDVAVAGGSAWVSNENDWTVTRVAADTGSIEATIDEKVDGAKGIVAAADSIWVLEYPDSWLARIPLKTELVADTLAVDEPYVVSVGPAGFWVGGRRAQSLWHIDPARITVAESVHMPAPATALAVGQERVWVAHRPQGYVTSLDPVDGALERVTIGHGISDIAVGGGAVWVTVP
jgi:YVTN family beta-propeller protein